MTDAWNLVTDFWAAYSEPIVVGTGAALTLLLAVLIWRFLRTANRSKIVSTIAAVVVMAWTSEGLLAVALRKFELPVPFAVMTFFVFEAMMIAAALKAEEHRAATGSPGPAGGYVFVLAVASGVIAAFGAHNPGEVVLRVILPPLAVGLWWIFLVAERAGDLPEWSQPRDGGAEGSWTITPRTMLVRLGLMRPGKVTVTEAQRQYRVARMVAFGCTIYRSGSRSPAAWWARRRLFRVARHADAAMIKEARRQVRRSVRAEQLIVPGVAELPPEVPAEASAPDVAELPVGLPAEPAPPIAPELPVDPRAVSSGAPTRNKTTGSSGGTSTRKSTRKKAEPRTRRTAEETRVLIAELRAQDPDITQEAIAAALGVSTRYVRDVSPAKANGHRPDLAGVPS